LTSSATAADRINRIVIAAGIRAGFREMLADRFEAPVEPLDR
jgi:hypothetical protein